MFSPPSRYAAAGTYQVLLPDGTAVDVTRIPAPVARRVLGWCRRSDGQRLDLIAYQYLGDATGFWRICEANGAICPDALAARDLIAIPPSGS